MTPPPNDITAPIPYANEGEEAWILSAEWVNFLRRKIEAPANMLAVYPLQIVRADSGMKLVLLE
jgi:hypothetical protein